MDECSMVLYTSTCGTERNVKLAKNNQNYNNMLSFITLSYVIWTHGNIALKLDQVFEACKCHIEQITYHG